MHPLTERVEHSDIARPSSEIIGVVIPYCEIACLRSPGVSGVIEIDHR
jgi:hypothetical protein